MLYNLYRPEIFSEVKGQEDVLITLKKQSEAKKFGHAYLLAGHRGTGKTTISRILAKAVNCEHPTENGPCLKCSSCQAYKESLDIIELDAASNNGVDKIKELLAQVKYRPVQLKNKVFIIDEVHNLSAAAFDTLLKPLEEPPDYCTFILCTTELQKIPVTIRSRCEEYTFHPIGAEPMRERLKEVMLDQNITCEEDALNLIIRNANGGLRDALSLLEQLMISTDKKITTIAAKKRLGSMDNDDILATLDSVFQFDTCSCLQFLKTLLDKGKSPSLITENMLSVLTDIITVKTTECPDAILNSRDYIQAVVSLGNKTDFNHLYWLCEQCCDLRNSIRGSVNPVMDIKLSMIKMSSHELASIDTSALAMEVANLKKDVNNLKSFIEAFEEYNSYQNQRQDNSFYRPQNSSEIPFEGLSEKKSEDTFRILTSEPDQKGGEKKDRTEANKSLEDSDLTAPDLSKIPR